MKTCPISNKPVDLMTLGPNALLVASFSGRWYSKVFDSVDEAYGWRASFDLLTAVKDTEEDEDPQSGMVRLVGVDWFTNFMPRKDLDAWLAKAKPKKAKTRSSSATTSN